MSLFHFLTGPEPSSGEGNLEATPCPLSPPWAQYGEPPLPLPGLGLTPIPSAGSWMRSHLLSLPRARVCAVLPHCAEGLGVTLQVSRRVQIFLVSGFITPHCLLRSHSFPVGKAVPMNPKAISGRVWRLQAKGLERAGPKAGEPLGLKSGAAAFQRYSSGQQQLSARCKNHPVPIPAPALLWGAPSLKQGNRYQETKAATGIWDARETSYGRLLVPWI